MLGDLLRRLLTRPRPAPGVDFATAYRLYEEGRLDEAEGACDGVRDAARPDVDFLRGLIARRRGNFEAAARAFAAANDARPNEPTFLHALASADLALQRHAKAVAAFERFVACAPEGDPRTLYACVTAGACCMVLGDAAARESWFERARGIDAANAAILISGVLQDQSTVEEARAAMAASPRAGAYVPLLRRALMIPQIYQSREDIEATRERLASELAALAAHAHPERTENPLYELGLTAFYLAYHNADNAAFMKALCAAVRRAYVPPPVTVERAPRSERIHIGFVSTYFHSHSIGRITIGLIRDLPRDRFSVTVFAIAPLEDDLRAQIERAADRYVRLPDDLDHVRNEIAAARLDALVYADIGMHPLTYFLALSRLAPLQVVAWGHPVTTGIDTIDCFLSADGVEIPEAQPHYTERLLRPKAFFLGGYERPLAPPALTRVALGLPDDRHLYACLQPAFKLHPDFDAVLREILARDPRGEILLLEAKPVWLEQVKRRFARTLSGYEGRVKFLPRMTHPHFMATLACADVSLDPFYFGGGNSSAEALSVGVPLVTLPGTHLYGRLTLGLYADLEFDECVAQNAGDYVERALKLGTDRGYRASVSAELRNRAPRLFERKDATLAFADCLIDLL